MPSNLRSSVIRLAHANPELRPHLLPLLKEAAGEVNVPFKNNHILDDAHVYAGADVWGRAKVYGDAKVGDLAEVYGTAKVYGHADISGTAEILGGNWDGSEGPITEGKWKSPGVPA